MTSPHVIFVNGPPRCGKDTFGEMVRRNVDGYCVPAKFANSLKRRTHNLYGLRAAYAAVELPADHYESTKDVESRDFMGLTPRQAYIAVSERLMKPLHGDDVFGHLLLKDLMPFLDDSYEAAPDVIVITDSGFAAEAAPVVERFGADNCSLVRLKRPGCTFDGDSRSYIEIPGVRTFEVANNGSLDVLEHGARQTLWLLGIELRGEAA